MIEQTYKNKLAIDMHCHTTFSDGKDTPEELVRRALSFGINGLCVTDHDTMKGIAESKEAGKRLGVTVMGGVELSIEFSTELHILVYHPENGSELSKELELIRERRINRVDSMINKLKDVNIDLTKSYVMSFSSGESVGRVHVARAMVEKGYVKDIGEAFVKYLSIGRPGYVSHKRLSLEEALRLINECGGVSVWAHPLHTARSIEKLRPLYEYMKTLGLGGIECFHPSADYSTSDILRRWCKEDGLYVTGGSDWHGEGSSGELGSCMALWNPLKDYPNLAEHLKNGKDWL